VEAQSGRVDANLPQQGEEGARRLKKLEREKETKNVLEKFFF